MIEPKWGELLVISQTQCRSLISDREVLALVEQVLADYSNGDAVNPIKLHLPFFPDYYGWNNAMPSWLKKQDVHGIKWAGFGEYNTPKFGLPQCSAVIVLNDMATAFPIALLDGTTIMSMRTGAAAAIMAKHCCKSGACTLTIIGAGVQGTSGVEMTLLAMPQIQQVRVMDLRQEAVDKLIAKVSQEFPQVKFTGYTDMAASMAGSDIIMTAVHGAGNTGGDILDNVEFEPGVTVVKIAGGVSAGKFREKFDYVVLDFIACFVHRLNETIGYMKEVFGKTLPTLDCSIADTEIGDVITGKAPGRRSDDEIVYAGGVGMSIEDLIVANDIYQKAKAQGVGQVISLIDDLGL